MAGLTENGYTILRLQEILDNLRAKAVELFQDLVPDGDVVNTGDNSTLGRLIGIAAPSQADAWEASQELYDAFNINAATGIALDNLCTLGGVQRQGASSTLTTVKFTGNNGTALPAGTKLQGTNNGKFHSLVETIALSPTGAYGATFTVLTVANSTAYTISYQKVPDTLGDGVVAVTYTSTGSATEALILAGLATAINTAPHNTYLSASVVGTTVVVTTLDITSKVTLTSTANLNITKVQKIGTVRCDDTGPVEQPAGTITRISVPIVGLDTVTNPSNGIMGTDVETDEDFRARYIVAKFGDGQNLIESLYAALYALDGVESVIIVDNDTDTALVPPNPTVPAHSFYVVVLGGASADIAQAIWNNKPAGILSYGSTTVNVYDSQGVLHPISFDRPSSLDIYCTVNITVQEAFAPDGVDQIKQAVANHINALLIGEDVIYSRLYTPINGVAGHYVNSLTLGTAPTPVGTVNIPVNFDEKATITVDDVVVVTV